jgi:alpha-tubulin suppressor-like RCC1 family protein
LISYIIPVYAVIVISAGNSHTCAIKNGGQVVCWEGNSSSQATPPTGLSHVQAISAGKFHTCALTNDGQVICWGNNDHGQITFPSISLPI